VREDWFIAWSEIAEWLEGFGLGFAGWFAEVQPEGVLYHARERGVHGRGEREHARGARGARHGQHRGPSTMIMGPAAHPFARKEPLARLASLRASRTSGR
jgi:hypothetical protein